MREPSEFALKILEGFKVAATREVKRHLSEGRSVSGFLNGKLVRIHPDGLIEEIHHDTYGDEQHDQAGRMEEG